MNEELLQRIADYKTPAGVIDRLATIPTVMLVGITAAGKDTIKRAILIDKRFSRVVTSTTRAPRMNNGIMEQEGLEYYFLTLDEASAKIDNGEYIEVMNVHGRANGSLVKEYERIAGLQQIAVTDIDYQGALAFLGFGMQKLHVLFIVPPSFEVWLQRLNSRDEELLKGNTEEVISRFKSAQREIETALVDPRFIPIMNIDSVRSAQEIIDIATTGVLPSAEEIAASHERLRLLNEGITNYISQLS